MLSYIRRATVCFSLLFFLLSACQTSSNTFKVTQVIDGDTIVLDDGYHVRYIGIDAPEKDEPYYSEARQANAELVLGKRVRLEKDISDQDKYNRLLRYVYVDGGFVNAEMVKGGYAYAKAYPPDIKYQVYLEVLENEARQTKKGLWGYK